MAREDEIQRLLNKDVLFYIKKRQRAKLDPWHVSSDLTRFRDPRLLHMQSGAITLVRQRNRRYRAELAAEKARHEAFEKAWQLEKTNWIETFGSPRLKKARAAGYSCEVPYAQERVNREWGEGWTIDNENTYRWKPATYPTEDSLDLLKVMINNGYKAEIVWLIANNGAEDHFKKCEGLVLYGYLGKYTLVREMR